MFLFSGEEQQRSVGILFLHLETVLYKIAQYPEHYSFLQESYRQSSLTVYPFRIVFKVINEQ